MRFGTAVVLAGGQSRRMGFDKQSIRIDDRLLVSKTIERLSADFSDIIVVTHTEEYYRGERARITKDRLPSTGPLAGIHAGLLLAKSEYAFVIACDMPHYNPAYARVLREALPAEAPGILTSTDDGWIEPFHAYYRRSLAPAIERYLSEGGRNVKRFADEQGFAYLPLAAARAVDPDLRLFQNLNTPEELAAYRNEKSSDAE